MWYPIIDYSLEEARRFLLEDFVKVLRRTKYLYVDTVPPSDIGYGFFEPIQLCLCWCDFLGALWAGNAKIGNTRRIKCFVDNVLGVVNPRYCRCSDMLVKVYRHGVIHAYAPAGAFDIRTFDADQHLVSNGDRFVMSVQQLVDDMMAAIMLFANTLADNAGSTEPGTLGAFNAARRQFG